MSIKTGESRSIFVTDLGTHEHMRYTVHGFIGSPVVPTLTQDPVLRQGAVADRVGGLVGPQVVHWNAETPIHFLVVQDVMPVAGVKTHVNRETFIHQFIYYTYLLCIDE